MPCQRTSLLIDMKPATIFNGVMADGKSHSIKVLGDVVTLYNGNIDVHFTNDGTGNQASSDDEFIWLRGNNIDLVHKLPQIQRSMTCEIDDDFYSVRCSLFF